VALDEEGRRAKAHALRLARSLVPRITDLERRAALAPAAATIPLPVATLADRVAWLDAELRKLRERADRAEALARRAGARSGALRPTAPAEGGHSPGDLVPA
jgi:hypothetical protein